MTERMVRIGVARSWCPGAAGRAVVACLVAMLLVGPSLGAQGAPEVPEVPVVPLAPDSVLVPVPPKSPATAVGLGLVLPGSAHWYAGERRRGAIVAAAYWTGVAIVAGGRTDGVGKAGGAVLLTALGFSIVDGVRAVGRFNRTRRS